MSIHRCLNKGAALEVLAITATAPGQRLALTMSQEKVYIFLFLQSL